MKLDKDWSLIKDIFESGVSPSMHCAIGSVDRDGKPHAPRDFVFTQNVCQSIMGQAVLLLKFFSWMVLHVMKVREKSVVRSSRCR